MKISAYSLVNDTNSKSYMPFTSRCLSLRSHKPQHGAERVYLGAFLHTRGPTSESVCTKTADNQHNNMKLLHHMAYVAPAVTHCKVTLSQHIEIWFAI